MTAIDYPGCEERLKVHEGGEYTDGVHPYDPGGPTRWGITIADAKMYWKSDSTAEDVRGMPWSVAQAIYRSKYWARQRCDDLPAGVDDCIFDYGVNSGYARSGKVLRRVLGMPDDDWHTTDAVVAACANRDPHKLIDATCDERMKFLEGLSIWPTYRGGWTTRVREVRAYAHSLADHAATPVSTAMPKPTFTPIAADKSAKAVHNPPATAKKVIAVGGGAAVVASGGLVHWMGAHPFETGGLVAAGAVLVGLGLHAIERSHQAKQEGPTPGIIPVPIAPPAHN
jgi:lysozyme family protein